jgi:hypothetical protein
MLVASLQASNVWLYIFNIVLAKSREKELVHIVKHQKDIGIIVIIERFVECTVPIPCISFGPLMLYRV